MEGYLVQLKLSTERSSRDRFGIILTEAMEINENSKGKGT